MASTRALSLHRRDDGRVLAGVAAGLGETFRIDPNIVRLAFVLLTITSGIGLPLYVAGWLLLPMRAGTRERPATDALQVIALGAVVVGLLSLQRISGLWLGDAIVWPLVLAAVGLALVWGRVEGAPVSSANLERLQPAARDALGALVGNRRGAIVRIAVGAVLVFGGVIALASLGSLRLLPSVLIGGAVVLIGAALLLAPVVIRFGNAFAQERRERIRAAERADVAAHLHDSVLQTLALVQRKADDSREVRRLARRQERELRSWLLGGDEAVAPDDTLGSTLEAIAADVEDTYGVAVEVVRVRDCPATPALEPLVLATREAMVNAARHSGATSVSVYVEVEPQRATVFVRDRGRGFDPASVPSDRRGVAESIVGRLARHGGEAVINSQPGEGTEVQLVLHRSAA